MDVHAILRETEAGLKTHFRTGLAQAGGPELHAALTHAVMAVVAQPWLNSAAARAKGRRAYYLSAEYLIGRMIHNNLYALGILDDVKAALGRRGVDLAMLEDIEDPALGNGGLGRLAACFLDSAATMGLPLDGYGIRYTYGLFRQSFRNGFQHEEADDWQRQGDPWSRRVQEDIRVVRYADMEVNAVPYDMPVIGYHSSAIGTLRLFQAEALRQFDFSRFNEQEYDEAVRETIAAQTITNVLYPNDSTRAGRILRLRQEYFLSSASMQDIVAGYKRHHDGDLSHFVRDTAIQLNDTHPVLCIPELVRILQEEGFTFKQALAASQQVFSYTNHTIMAEALEKWETDLVQEILPDIFQIIFDINAQFCGELMLQGFNRVHEIAAIQGNRIHMANLAIYASRTTNGVAQLHTRLLTRKVFPDFYTLYPNKFQNKTNGVTQRRWLGLCNPDYAALITNLIGDGWLKDFSQISRLEQHIDNGTAQAFRAAKQRNKQRLSDHILAREGVRLPPEFLFDVQIKRMHEYKRQLLNAFSILDTYFGLKDGRIQDFWPTAYIFGAKAAPGYRRAKAIIKFINEVARLVNGDQDMEDKMRVVFVQNYNCSYAEHIIPAADLSQQISPAGTEASGTGNMKLMINGAPTLGTYDGANIEIFQQAGEENNYVFGRRVEELAALRSDYSPIAIGQAEPRVMRVVQTLVDGTFDDGGGVSFQELYHSLTAGSGYDPPDQYFNMLELMDYAARRLDANRDYARAVDFSKKGLRNTAAAGKFSSDRTIAEYADEIWHIGR